METTSNTTRRRLLAGIGSALLAVPLAGCSGGSGSDATEPAQTETAAETETAGGIEEPDYGGWFDGVDNYESTVDRTDTDEVTVSVGAGSSGFRFDPPAVAVSPGTTVVWEWTGKGGSHNVVAESGDFESDLTGDEGHTFEQPFEDTGVVKYYCSPHKTMGMKGGIAVVE